MVVICFMVDLRSLAPSLLTDIKQSLLQLANLYAVSESSRDGQDRIGLCYLLCSPITYSNELKIAYSPRGTFRLCNFHQAVNSLPIGAFLPRMNFSGDIYNHGDFKLSTVLSDEVLYSWGGTDTVKKLIVLSSYIVGNTDSHIQKTLMCQQDAGNKYVSVEFVLLEQESIHLRDMPDTNSFFEGIRDLDNCSFRTYFPDECVLAGLVKRWLRELKDDIEGQTQARFIFKSNLLGSVNHISCNLFKSVNQIIDRFCACQTCRCHIVSSDDEAENKFSGHYSGSQPLSFCPVPGHYSGTSDLIEHSVKVEGEAIHSLPSFQSCIKLQQDASPVDIFIVQRTKLGSLSEGVITGTPYIVSPLPCQELEAASDGIDKSELNTQLFQGLCSALHSLDEGLVCFSHCNIETMMAAAFRCYYIVQPSDRGPMLLRRLAASEEILLIPDVNWLGDSSVSKEIESCILASLLQIESRAYNPVEHDRGFHHKLNLLVQESLQFGKSTPKDGRVPSDAKEATVQAKPITEEKTHNKLDMQSEEDRTSACIAKEWEQLIVDDEDPNTYSSTPTPTSTPRCIPKPKLEKSVVTPTDIRRVDVGTSKILERLEVPRQMKSKAVSPITTGRAMAGVGMPQKKTLVPLQPIKPNFQRLKRKQQ